MARQLTPPGQMAPKRLTALFFGVPGTRKSTLANTAPRPVLPVALDTGYGRSKWAHPALTPNEVDRWEDLLEATQNLDDVATVIIDPISYVIDLVDDWTRRRFPKSAQVGGGFTPNGWGIRNRALISWLTHLKGNVHRIFLAHETTDDFGGDRKILPIISGRAFNVITQECDLIGRTIPVGNDGVEQYAVEFRATESCPLLKSTGGVEYVTDVGNDLRPAMLCELFDQTRRGVQAEGKRSEEAAAKLVEWSERIASADTAVLTEAVEKLSEASPMERAFIRPTVWKRAKAIGAKWDIDDRKFYIPVEEPEGDA